MRRLLIRKSCWLVPLLAASISCGGSSGAGPAPNPAAPTPSIALVTTSTRCAGPFHPGESVPGACVFEVGGALSRQISAYADLRAFGGRADAGLVRCPACGGPPWTFDVDLRIPADIAPGPQTFNVWAIDDQGQRVDTTAVVQIAAR